MFNQPRGGSAPHNTKAMSNHKKRWSGEEIIHLKKIAHNYTRNGRVAIDEIPLEAWPYGRSPSGSMQKLVLMGLKVSKPSKARTKRQARPQKTVTIVRVWFWGLLKVTKTKPAK